MKPHYFDQDAPDADDLQLAAAIDQGYVPAGCLLGGPVVMAEVGNGLDPCGGCHGPREKCGGRERRDCSARRHLTERQGAEERQYRGGLRERQSAHASDILRQLNRPRPIPGSNRELALAIVGQERGGGREP